MEANAAPELNSLDVSVDSLTEKYADSGSSASVDEELAAMKAKLGV